MATVKRQKLAWFRHVAYHNRLSRIILQGTLEGSDTVVGRRNARWTISKSGHPYLARAAHKGLLQKRLEEDLC